MKRLFRFLVTLTCICGTNPVFAKCLDGLSRPVENNYQPVLSCKPDQLHNCISGTSLLFLFDLSPNQLASLRLNSLDIPSQRQTLLSLFLQDLRKTTYLYATCESLSTTPSNLYTCFQKENSSLLVKSYPVYSAGLPVQSAVNGISYVRFNPSLLSNYYVEYRCSPDQPAVVKLFQYHFGTEVRPYFRNGKELFSNPTGHILGVLRVSSIPRAKFLQKPSKKRRVGFSMDPGAIAPILNRLSPNEVRQ